MLMLHRVLHFIITAYLSQPSLIHETQFLEQMQTSIYRSQADGLALAISASVQFLGIYMLTGVTNQV